jgi:hypothetical protein
MTKEDKNAIMENLSEIVEILEKNKIDAKEFDKINNFYAIIGFQSNMKNIKYFFEEKIYNK